MFNPPTNHRRFSTLHTILTVVLLSIFLIAPLGTRIASASALNDTTPFQFKASASVQKGLDLLKKYGIPESAMPDLVSLFSDKTVLANALKALKSVKLTDTQISEFVDAAYELATDKKDPLTTKAFKAWVAAGAKAAMTAKKISTNNLAKLAKLGGAASKPGAEKTTPPTLEKIKADLKAAEPSLSDADIAELLFWYSLGFDQISFEVFEVIYLQEELAHYGVPAEEITFITEHFEDKAAVDEAIGKLSVADDIRQTMLGNYEAKLEELGPEACGCAAAQAMLLTGKAIMEENGVSLENQAKIVELFTQGKFDEAGALAVQSGVPQEQVQGFMEAAKEVQDIAKDDYAAYMAEQQNEVKQESDPEELNKAVEESSQEPALEEPDHTPDNENG